MDLNAYLQDLEFLVNIDSGPDAPEGQTRIAEFFQNRFAALGWQTDLYPLPGHDAPCLVCRNRQAGHYDVLLIGHIDTVFPKGTAAQRPFRRDEARAYGPGVLDMKQGALMMYYVLRDLPAPVCQKLNILAVFNPDEEIGSPHSQPLTDSLAAQTDYVLVYEGASADGARCARRKGRLTMTMDFTGKPCHCGYVFQNDGRSAISEMARWIVALDALQDQARGTSVNVGVVSGGTNLNTVAEHASMQVDVRFLQNSESRRMDDTLAALLQQAERRGIQVQIHSRKLTPALEPTPPAGCHILGAGIHRAAPGRGIRRKPSGPAGLCLSRRPRPRRRRRPYGTGVPESGFHRSRLAAVPGDSAGSGHRQNDMRTP